MKKTILLIAASMMLFAGMGITSCNSPEDKVENAGEKVDEAHDDLAKAQEEYVQEIDNYRRTMAERADANQRKIEELRAESANKKAAAREEYNKKIAAIQERNDKMKMKMAEYKADGKENWENFKAEFNHDMDELGNALSDVGKDNVK